MNTNYMLAEFNSEYIFKISSFFENTNRGVYPPGMVKIHLDLLDEVELPNSNMPYNSFVSRFTHWELMNTPKQSAKVFTLAETMMAYFCNYWCEPIEYCSSYYGGDWYYDCDRLAFTNTDYNTQWRVLFVISQLLTPRCSPQGPLLLKKSNIITKEGAKVASAMLMLGVDIDRILEFLSYPIISSAIKNIKDKREYLRGNNHKHSYITTINNMIKNEESNDNRYLLDRLIVFFGVYSDAYKFHRIISIDSIGVGRTLREVDRIEEFVQHLNKKSIFSVTHNKELSSVWYGRRQSALGPRHYYTFKY